MPIKDREKRNAYKREYNSRLEVKEKNKAYRKKHADEISKKKKEYRETHSDEIAKRKKEYYEEHKNEKREYDKKYNEENKEIIKQKRKEYRKKNKDKIREAKRQYANSPAKYATWYPKISLYYSSDEIRQDPENKDLIQVRCYYNGCREWFNPTNQQLSIRYRAICGLDSGRNRQGNLYCSDECKNKCSVFRKRKQPNLIDNNIGREVQPELRKMVLARDNYTCQREGCGKSLTEFPDLVLHCHHKFPLNEDPICSADIDNCITLCAECHKWVHMNVPGCSTADLRCSEK